jgi:hypothetical protein
VQVSVVRDSGIVMRFTREFDDTFTAVAPINAIIAYNGNSDTLAYHGPGNKEPFAFTLTADGAARGFKDPFANKRRWHAILMIASWGLLLPLGVAMANTLRTYGPIWCGPPVNFRLHTCAECETFCKLKV